MLGSSLYLVWFEAVYGVKIYTIRNYKSTEISSVVNGRSTKTDLERETFITKSNL